MKISKKVLSVTMSMVMLGSQTMPTLAAPVTGTAGTANILDYAVESVVIPTTLKITLNPNGYGITTGYEKATTYAANTTYYTESGGTYTKATVADETAFNAGTFYTAVTSTAQVVSLNYGIANKSTDAKTVKVDFAATYTETAGKTAIEFVDSTAKAQAYDETNNANGAKAGEHKMYLAVASAAALPTANTHKKTADQTITSGKTYYTKGADGSFTEVASPVAGDLGTYYEDDTVIGTEITAAELSHVDMTAATTGSQAFAKGTTNKADASIAYSLNAAAYAVKDGETIDFDTAQTDLTNKLEMSTLGGVAGFTLTGAVNPNADWTQADATAITITPTYTIATATGAETAVDSGAYNQVNLGPTLAQTSYTKDANNSPIVVTVNNLGDDTISAVINNGSELGAAMASIAGNKVTLTSALLRYVTAPADFKIVTAAGKELTFSVSPQ